MTLLMIFQQKYRKQGNSTTYFNAVYNQKTWDRERKGCILLLSKKNDLRLANNY